MQTNPDGKFLTTDGTTATWDYVLPEAGDDWEVLSLQMATSQFGALTGDNPTLERIRFRIYYRKIADDYSKYSAWKRRFTYDSPTGVFTFTPAAVNTFDGTFSSLTSKTTTIAGYGITDALEIGTTATTALAGNTSIPSAVSELSNDSAFITNSITTDFT